MGTMLRLVDGVFYEGELDGGHELVHRDLGHGHHEVSIRQTVAWRELKTATQAEAAKFDADRDEQADERREANRKRAARRATKDLRHKVKAGGMDAMLTLTYRELQTDLALCKKHLKEFNRRMERVIPGWRYVAAFERQARGAWHVHMAIQRLPKTLAWGTATKVKSFNVVRSIWRSVVGVDNGNIDQSARKRTSSYSPAKVASYLSKYMMKAFMEGEDCTRRYSATRGLLDGLPAPFRARSADLVELIKLAYDRAHRSGCDTYATLRKLRLYEWVGGGSLDAAEVDRGKEPHRLAPVERLIGFFMCTGPLGGRVAA